MRELSLQELHQAYGGKLDPGQPSQELVSTTATMGHAAGIFLRGLKTRDFDSSVTELADSMKFCRKFLSSLHSVYPLSKLKRYQPVTAAFHFGCGIYKALYPDRRGD
jgi:hypothetical protein